MNKEAQERTMPWLKKAWEDLMYGQSGLIHSPKLTSQICFSAQQCSEKSLKAFLTYEGYEFDKTHNLPALLQGCIAFDKGLRALETCCKRLTPFAVDARYPGDFPEISKREAELAIECAEKIFTFVAETLGLPADYTEYDDA